MRIHFLLALLAAAQVSLPESPARAQGVGQTMVDWGTAQFKAGNYAGALVSFEEALRQTGEQGVHFLIGRCHEELGHLVEARAAYERFVRVDAPKEAKAKAADAIKRIDARLSTGELVFEIAPAGAEVFADGSPVGVAPVAARQVAPGRHEVTAKAVGHLPATTRVEVPGGGSARAVLTLEPEPVARVAPLEDAPLAPAVVTPPPEPKRPEAPPFVPTVTTGPGNDGAQTTWGWVTLGLGVSLAAAGGVSYGLGERDHRAITETGGYGTDGVTDMTRHEALELTDSGDLKKTVGYALWGAGAAAVLTGIVLVATDTDPGPEAVVPAPVEGGALLGASGRF